MKYSYLSALPIMALLSAIGLGYLVYDCAPRPDQENSWPDRNPTLKKPHGDENNKGYSPLADTHEAANKNISKIESLIHNLEAGTLPGENPERKIQITQDLNREYFASNSKEVQKQISNALSLALRNEENPEIARAIAFSHSRLFFDENTLPNLKSAYNRKIISFDDYHGELAHVFPGAPDETREKIVNEISKSHNRYALDIVAARTSSEEDISLSTNEILDLQGFLASNEPIFDGSEDAFGYFDAILYSNWLIAISRLQHAAGGSSAPQFIGKKLLSPTTDPRATVAFLISGYAESLTDAQKKEVQWDAIRARALEFMRQHPDAAGLQQIGEKIKK